MCKLYIKKIVSCLQENSLKVVWCTFFLSLVPGMWLEIQKITGYHFFLYDLLIKQDDHFWTNYWAVIAAFLTVLAAIEAIRLQLKDNREKEKRDNYNHLQEIARIENADAFLEFADFDNDKEHEPKVIKNLAKKLVKLIYIEMNIQDLRDDSRAESGVDSDNDSERNNETEYEFWDWQTYTENLTRIIENKEKYKKIFDLIDGQYSDIDAFIQNIGDYEGDDGSESDDSQPKKPTPVGPKNSPSNGQDASLLKQSTDESQGENSDEKEQNEEKMPTASENDPDDSEKQKILGFWILNREKARHAKYLVGVATKGRRVLAVFELKNEGAKFNETLGRNLFQPVAGKPKYWNVSKDKQIVLPHISEWKAKNPVLYYKDFLNQRGYKSDDLNKEIENKLGLEPGEFQKLKPSDIIVVRTFKFN